MSTETLRRAAALMRTHAEAARSYYSAHHPKAGQEVPWFGQGDLYDFDDGDGPHIIGMSPAVALAVADWLDGVAARVEVKVSKGGNESAVWSHEVHALAVARAYLGERS